MTMTINYYLFNTIWILIILVELLYGLFNLKYLTECKSDVESDIGPSMHFSCQYLTIVLTISILFNFFSIFIFTYLMISQILFSVFLGNKISNSIICSLIIILLSTLIYSHVMIKCNYNILIYCVTSIFFWIIFLFLHNFEDINKIIKKINKIKRKATRVNLIS